jgi:hypothetical protein
VLCWATTGPAGPVLGHKLGAGHGDSGGGPDACRGPGDAAGGAADVQLANRCICMHLSLNYHDAMVLISVDDRISGPRLVHVAV